MRLLQSLSSAVESQSTYVPSKAGLLATFRMEWISSSSSDSDSEEDDSDLFSPRKL